MSQIHLSATLESVSIKELAKFLKRDDGIVVRFFKSFNLLETYTKIFTE